MNISGGTFRLSWDAPNPDNNVDHTTIYEIVGGNHNVVQTVQQPNNTALFDSVPPGQHAYVAKFHNAAGDSVDYSNEVDVLVVSLPLVVTNLAFTIS